MYTFHVTDEQTYPCGNGKASGWKDEQDAASHYHRWSQTRVYEVSVLLLGAAAMDSCTQNCYVDVLRRCCLATLSASIFRWGWL